jgi:hypothetical protein
LHPGKTLSLWFQDEARFGMQGSVTRIWAQTGSRPRAICQHDFEWTYLYGSVEPLTGRVHGCRLPEVSTVAMNSYLTDFSKQMLQNEHALMVLDGAAWHKAGKLKIPKNITLLVQPPYSPELNPMELVWGNGRRNYFCNRNYETIEDVEQAAEQLWLKQTQNAEFMQSLCGFEWILSSIT